MQENDCRRAIHLDNHTLICLEDMHHQFGRRGKLHKRRSSHLGCTLSQRCSMVPSVYCVFSQYNNWKSASCDAQCTSTLFRQKISFACSRTCSLTYTAFFNNGLISSILLAMSSPDAKILSNLFCAFNQEDALD